MPLTGRLFENFADFLVKKMAGGQVGERVEQAAPGNFDKAADLLHGKFIGAAHAFVQIGHMVEDVVHRRKGLAPIALEEQKKQGVEQRLHAETPQYGTHGGQHRHAVNERPFAVGHMAENGEGQPPLKKADETAAALLFDIVEELFPTAAEQKGFLVDQIFYIHHQLVGVRVRDDRAAAVHQKIIAVFGTGAERRQLAHVRQRSCDETDADDFTVFFDRHELGEIHVARGPGGEGVAELPFAGSHDPGDIVALQLGDFRP